MGARPEQQLALNFLDAIHRLWIQHPGSYTVRETIDDLVPALAQMCIKALAADVRDAPPADEQEIAIDGQLIQDDGATVPLTLRDVVNKIIHGTPTLVEVRDREVLLHFRNNFAGGRNRVDKWTCAWFSGTNLLKKLNEELSKHEGPQVEKREREIAQLLETLGVDRFLPTAISENDCQPGQYSP
ncbi:hypothetical protein [Microbispora sp. GKU 823]|uniref:hypothetical protein n=1 Tax=Microbispora sp. GKU 823 TaxID=1652100 RepID=UPI00117E434B|nr:hypothetical protein [Microbispora sp. GKU 823]